MRYQHNFHPKKLFALPPKKKRNSNTPNKSTKSFQQKKHFFCNTNNFMFRKTVYWKKKFFFVVCRKFNDTGSFTAEIKGICYSKIDLWEKFSENFQILIVSKCQFSREQRANRKFIWIILHYNVHRTMWCV